MPDKKPEYLVKVTLNSGFVEWKLADDQRHLKRTIAGLKGKRTRWGTWSGAPKSVDVYDIVGTRWVDEVAL